MTNVVPFPACELEFPLTADELATVQARAAMAGLSFDAYVRRQVLKLLSERSTGDGAPEED